MKTLNKETGEFVDNDKLDALIKKGFRKLFFKTPYNHNPNEVARQTATHNVDPTLTQQHHVDEADINTIMKRFGVTAVQHACRQIPPSFIDVPDNLDMQSAWKMVNDGIEAFEQQPAEIRAAFRNDPARYIGAVDQAIRTGDRKTLEALGLSEALPPKPPETTPDRKIPDAPPDPKGGKTT